MRSLTARSTQTMLLLDSEIGLEFLKISVGSGAVVSSEYTTIYRYVLEIRHPAVFESALKRFVLC